LVIALSRIQQNSKVAVVSLKVSNNIEPCWVHYPIFWLFIYIYLFDCCKSSYQERGVVTINGFNTVTLLYLSYIPSEHCIYSNGILIGSSSIKSTKLVLSSIMTERSIEMYFKWPQYYQRKNNINIDISGEGSCYH
jgi:hypothetical protein